MKSVAKIIIISQPTPIFFTVFSLLIATQEQDLRDCGVVVLVALVNV